MSISIDDFIKICNNVNIIDIRNKVKYNNNHILNARNIDKSELTKYCLIMGNEGNGVSKEVKELCDCNFYIPMTNDVESLNVGVACSIILYELER